MMRLGDRWQDFSRRKFLVNASALGAASLLGLPQQAQAEPPPETTRIRLVGGPAICIAPQYVAEALLRAEGFSEIQYVKFDSTTTPGSTVGSGMADIILDSVGDVVTAIDAGASILTLAGVHLGCYELFAVGDVRAIRDLKGKTISVDAIGAAQHTLSFCYGRLRRPRPAHKTSIGPCIRRRKQFSSLRKARSMHISASRPSRRSSERGRSAMS